MTDLTIRDKLRGCLVGGGAGDALGYPVEFYSEHQIFDHYGAGGITHYSCDPGTGEAILSDDTQMTLFTASALLFGLGRQRERGISGEPRTYALFAYLGWLHTQEYTYSHRNVIPEDATGWASWKLRNVPGLYVRRAPGMTCLSALKSRKEQWKKNVHIADFIADPLNDSKGCGGVMRVAPLGFLHFMKPDRVATESAQVAAITHSHPLGYMPAAMLGYIIHRLAAGEGLAQSISEALAAMGRLYPEEPCLPQLIDIMERAVALSQNSASDLQNIHMLGEGWVAEEALAIAVYCSLKYQNDFSKAIIAAVNHSGDSDSTGAITGNILGAHLGYAAIDPQWKQQLELHDLLLDMADSLWEAL